MNALERAVIEAARLAAKAPSQDSLEQLEAKLRVLDKAQADSERVIEIPWSQVCEGDELKSVKNGKFYEVEWARKRPHGSYQMKLAEINMPINRPTAAEPTAFVKRGPAGGAVDVWVDVLSSGGK